ncbi:ATP-binding protein [Paenibacillus sacheonensis]|uniref:Circadian input-output histidine kinase CikA n=1 Tax=Paenibacillus sacheonensis TaxID=742054 RepID=A0A7X4YU70_9BACL|nr:ATP-binding protein [Paenibacillus sacheonensis]MBM7568975.1 two-component system sensor histidine kinase/response regulator [Paenibacillus sacheonensis]NBC72652.1 response regulator [Paenibacillus sacheonensis]
MVKFSLRTKALVLILLVTAGAQSIVGYGNYSAAKSTIIDTMIDKASTKVQNTADKLASWIATRRAEAEVMSRTDQVRFGSEAERLAYFRNELERSGSPFVTIGFADPAGRAELSSGDVIHIADEPSFDAAMKGKVEVTDPFVREEGGPSIIVIQVPVYGKDNEIVGVLDAVMSAERIFTEQLHVRIGESDGVFLYNDGSSTIVKDGLLEASDAVLSPDLPPSTLEQLHTKLSGSARLKGASGESFLFYGAVEGTDWHIALNVPLREIEAPLSGIKRQSMLSIAVAEAVLTLLFFLFSQPIISRIKRILSVTEAAAAGRFDVNNVSDEGGDELSQLSSSVNQMKLHLSGMFGRMDAMINQNQFMFIVLDSDYRVTYFSKTAERLLGYTAEEMLHKATALTFIDPQDIAAEAKRLSGKYGRLVPADITVFELLRKEQFTYEREWNYIRKDGTRFPVSHSSNGMRDREGRFIGVAGIARDITQQKQAENVRNRQLKVMGAAKDLIATFDEQGRLLYINEAGRMLLGMKTKDTNEVPKRTIAELLDGSEDARAFGYQEKEALLRSLQGAFIPVSKILVVHHDDLSGEVFYSCIARDISEAKRVQLELEQAKREAESANVAKSHFLAQISHEIRTPLAGIIGLTGLMQKTELTPLQTDYLHKTRDSSEALLAIINDILDFSKAEAGRIELNEVPFDPYGLIQRLTELLGVFVGGKEQFHFIAETPKLLPELLLGDWLRIEQILLNLCINAIKFTDSGYVRLRLQALPGTEGDGSRARIAFTVEDTGIGMTEEQQSRLFEPFVQANAETNRKYGGTGLGLVIVKRLVELMGGTIHVGSAIGQGSTFSFTLDMAVAEPPRPDRFVIESGSECSVWVVENHPLMGEHLCSVLEDSGLMPMTLRSWKSARERLVRSGIGVRPFAMLLDFEMPDMYAEETWYAMHETAKEAGVKTVALTTAYGREELLKLPAENRPDTILVKPVTRVGLYRSLMTLFDRTDPEAAAGSEEAVSAAAMPERLNGTVLLAEDNVINQLVAVEQLREWGLGVDVAENGNDVLRMLTAKRYDLILMDIHMPEMDGDEAARIIRLDSKYDRIPIVGLTANIMQEDHDRYMQLGMNDVLTKPVDPAMLMRAIVKWLRYGKEPRIDTAKSKPGETTKGRQKGLEAAGTVYVPVPEEGEDWLEQGIPGLRLDEALQRVNGKRDILLHMLKLFVNDYRTFGERLQEALQAGDYAAARRMAHTLKGVAGNLSADALYAAAWQLERLLKAAGEDRSGPDTSAAAAEAAEALQLLLEAIKAIPAVSDMIS